MTQPIRIGIVGYGNLGRGVEIAMRQNPDMQLVAVFTRRDPATVKAGVPVLPVTAADEYRDKIDVMLLCGGSANDLQGQGPMFAAKFNTVDSFDTHAKIPEYFDLMNKVAGDNGHISIISTGWDPGLFSMMRLLAGAVLPHGQDYTFWGKGVSQGHSDAIRRISGVKDAKQYTIPVQEAIEQVRAGKNPKLTTRQKHVRECFVVAEPGADLAKIEEAIKTMPNYFADYDTTVHFISEEEFAAKHQAMPHGGFVFRSGNTGSGYQHIIEFSLKLANNPEFTASVLVAYARAAYRLSQEGQTGAKTVFDVPLAYLSPKSGAELRRELL